MLARREKSVELPTEHPYICAAGYLHDTKAGRIECPLCGHGAFTRKEEAAALWEHAHGLCCKMRPRPAATAFPA